MYKAYNNYHKLYIRHKDSHYLHGACNIYQARRSFFPFLLNFDHIVKSSSMLTYESLDVKRLFYSNTYTFYTLYNFKYFSSLFIPQEHHRHA